MPLSNMDKDIETSSVASTSTYSSTISLLRKLKPSSTTSKSESYSAHPRASPFKTSYPETDTNHPRWGPKSDLSDSKSKSKSRTPNDKSSSNEKMTYDIGAGAGAMSFSPYKASYPETDANYPRWGPKSDLSSRSKTSERKESKSKSSSDKKDDRLIFEIGEGAGATSFTPYRSSYQGQFKGDYPRKKDLGMTEMVSEKETKEERKKREKREKREKGEERVRMDKEMVKFPYTAASLMKA